MGRDEDGGELTCSLKIYIIFISSHRCLPLSRLSFSRCRIIGHKLTACTVIRVARPGSSPTPSETDVTASRFIFFPFGAREVNAHSVLLDASCRWKFDTVSFYRSPSPGVCVCARDAEHITRADSVSLPAPVERFMFSPVLSSQ